jgi:hypothetical protein
MIARVRRAHARMILDWKKHEGFYGPQSAAAAWTVRFG